MTFRQYLCVVLIGLLTTPFFSQTGQAFDYNSSIRETYNHNWSIGAGVNVVVDNASQNTGLTDPGDSWNFSRPFYVSAEFYLNNQFSFMSMISFNQYTEGKNIDALYIIEGHEASYFAWDVNAKYYFRDLIKTYNFDPYVFLGAGYTDIGEYKGIPNNENNPPDLEFDEDGNYIAPSIGRLTFNAGLGFNFWFSDTWGLNLNLAGKWGIPNSDYDKEANVISNQFQYSLGALYVLK